MTRRLLHIVFLLSAVMGLTLLTMACSWNEEDRTGEYNNTPQGNFMALWTIMDEHYCFFDLKEKTLGVNWNEIRQRYSVSISDGMSSRALFEVLCSMIGELRDGHVNLTSSYDFGRNWSWKTDYPTNFSKDLRDRYLGKDYVIGAGGYYYRILNDNIGYLAIESFEETFSSGRLDVMFNKMAICNGIIIDVRNNGGGNITASENLASHFTEKEVTVSYSCYKTGPGHNDFSSLYENRISPAKEDLRWIKPVVVLINRGSYSTANDFACNMKALENVTLMGDTTGGGGGFPMSSELPNGWVVRFSSAPSFDADGNHLEFGIAPDIRLDDMKDEDINRGVDSYIEAARDFINDKLINP